MRIEKIYAYKPERVNVKFVSENESIDYGYNMFTQKITKIIFDDLAPDPVVYKPTRLQKIKSYIKAIFKSGLNE